MKNRLLVIFEGADGSGKTTLSKMLADKLGYQYIRQPNDHGALGFIREIVKGDVHNNLTMMERQLMHTCSHIFDLVKMGRSLDSFVMDRSPYSAIAYSWAMGIDSNKISILRDINLSAYADTVMKLFDGVLVIFMSTENGISFRESDNSFHEGVTTNEDLEREYNNIYQSLCDSKTLRIHDNMKVERVHNIPNDLNGTFRVILDKTLEFINSVPKI